MDTESNPKPFFLIGGAIVVIVVLLVVSKYTRDDDPTGSFGGNPPGAAPPGGDYQPLPFLPNAPLTQFEGGSPINDTPDITIVHDIRETMNRYPDRNTPVGWGGVPKPKQNPSGGG